MNPRGSLHKAVDGHLVVPFGPEVAARPDGFEMLQYAMFGLFSLSPQGEAVSLRYAERAGRTGGNAPKPFKKIEFFWLCEACATKFTLVTDAHTVARVVALRAQARAATAAL